MMKTYQKEEHLTSELAGLRQRVAELKTLATEHKRLDEALQESQQVLRKIFESVTDGISATDLDGITRCKPKNK
ncbi:MAG: hypothetical protein HQ588_05460 [Deltaproteobacteria bacterium]|nr:hypothetical protein [Deltaproteobacteria bacterium]